VHKAGRHLRFLQCRSYDKLEMKCIPGVVLRNSVSRSFLFSSCHSLSYVVPGLIPAEQYVFRVRAENIHGLSEASTESEPFQMGSDGRSCNSKTENFRIY
jgi:hypothetical protein